MSKSRTKTARGSIVLPGDMIPSMMSNRTETKTLSEEEKKRYAEVRAAAMNRADERSAAKFRKSKKSPKVRVRKSGKKLSKKSKRKSR